MAEKILGTDTLRQAYPKINDAIDEVGQSLSTANAAKTTADLAKAQAESIQTQLNTIVIEGDSSVEAAQARVDKNNVTHDTLKARMDSEQEIVETLSSKAIEKTTLATTTGRPWSTTNVIRTLEINGEERIIHGTPNFERKKVLFVGSSVLFGQGATGNNGWANRLKTELEALGYTCKNHGIPGNNTTNVLQRFYKDVIPEDPDFLIIGLSLHNEGLTAGDTTEEWSVAYKSFRYNMKRLINICRQHGIVPIIGNCYPNNAYIPQEYTYIKSMNAELENMGVYVIDFLGATDDFSGHWLAGSYQDSSHPNDIGHQAMFKAVPPSLFNNLATWDGNLKKGVDGYMRHGIDTTSQPIYVEFPHPLESFTVGFYVRMSTESAVSKAVCGFGTTGNARIRNYSGNDGKLSYVKSTDSSSEIISDVVPMSTGEWHHVAVSYSSILNLVRFYVDGEYVGEMEDELSLDVFTLGGSITNFANNAVNTDFKDLVIYRSRLNDNQIKALAKGHVLLSSIDTYCPLNDYDVGLYSRLKNLAPTSTDIKTKTSGWSVG
jgi:lysophospholipase L1-like esterase